MADTKSEGLPAHLVIALGHLGGTSACEPLLALARDRTERRATRQAAVTALGLLLDSRERDPLFEIDATLNPLRPRRRHEGARPDLLTGDSSHFAGA